MALSTASRSLDDYPRLFLSISRHPRSTMTSHGSLCALPVAQLPTPRPDAETPPASKRQKFRTFTAALEAHTQHVEHQRTTSTTSRSEEESEEYLSDTGDGTKEGERGEGCTYCDEERTGVTAGTLTAAPEEGGSPHRSRSYPFSEPPTYGNPICGTTQKRDSFAARSY